MSITEGTITFQATTNAQDILIISSACLSFLKSFVGAGSYSCWLVAVAFLELITTSLAFVIFILADFLDRNGDTEFGRDKLIYFLMFISAVATELADVATTQRTVVAYRTTKRRDGLSARLLECFEKAARRTHGISIAFLLVTNAIYFIVTFRLANWKVEFFGPSDFSSPTKQLVFAWIVTSLAIQVPVTAVHLFCEARLKNNVLKCGVLLCNLAVSALSITILTKVTPQEAGAFIFLQLIAIPQAIELVGEEARRECWEAFKEAPVDEMEDMTALEVMDWYGKRNSEEQPSTEKESATQP